MCCKLRCEKVEWRRKVRCEFTGEKLLFCCGRTPEDVILVVLVGFSAHFYQTRQSFRHNKLVHQVFVILERGQGERGEYSRAVTHHRQSQRLHCYVF